MRPRIPALAPVAVWLTFGSAAAIVLSIAASQILLGAAFIALLLSGEPLRLPRIKLPLAIFLAGTIIAWLASGDLKTGLPQIKKLIVFFELLIVYSCLRSIPLVRKLMLTWAALGTFTACFGFVQFGEKVAQAHRLGRDFYNFYVAARIKGFTSHWNTFSAEEMFVLLMLAAFLFFAPKSRRQWIWMLCAALAMRLRRVDRNSRRLGRARRRVGILDLALAALGGSDPARCSGGGVRSRAVRHPRAIPIDDSRKRRGFQRISYRGLEHRRAHDRSPSTAGARAGRAARPFRRIQARQSSEACGLLRTPAQSSISNTRQSAASPYCWYSCG